MRYYSTKNRSDPFSFTQAALTGLAPDGGLFIPETIPPYREAVRTSLGTMTLIETACETIAPYTEGEIPRGTLEEICAGAFTFPVPLVSPASGTARVQTRPKPVPLVLELFHGPTAAFKDVGARFMARTFSWLRRGEDRPLRILVATSGDTGGAVADGFYQVPGISVTILYPKGRVSELQEKQIASLGGNISALAVEASFDDCQALVKGAFADPVLREKCALSSANSINISRLIPQAVYYAAAAGKAFRGRLDQDGEATPRSGTIKKGGSLPPGLQAPLSGAPPSAGAAFSAGAETGIPAPATPHIFCVPSGNFGNLTAGLYALCMGAPIAGFIAATNVNRTVPDYLENGEYKTRLSQATISNAMDVGAPSNFERMTAHWNDSELKAMIRGAVVTDEETRKTIAAVYRDCGYYLDPHSAVGWTAVEKYRGTSGEHLAVLSTAHPAKFAETVEPLTGPVPVPLSIQRALGRTPQARTIPADPAVLRDILLANP